MLGKTASEKLIPAGNLSS